MTKRITYCGIFVALALVIAYMERFIVLPIPIPGVKLGLANIVTVLLLYQLGGTEAFVVMLLRIIVMGFLFGGVSPMLYSLSGGLVSFGMMWITKKTNWFSVVGVSVVGAYFHNIGQILLAMCIIQNTALLFYLPVLMIVGIFTGILIGVLVYKTMRSFSQYRNEE